MIIVSNGYNKQEFGCLQEIIDFFGETDGKAIIEGEHSEYSMTMNTWVEEDYPDSGFCDSFYP